MFVYWGSILVLVFVGVFAEDKSVNVGGIETKVLGQSGKITVSSGNESEAVTITYDAIREVETNGDRIVGHSFQSFAPLTFTFSPLENSTYMDSNVSVTQFSITADIDVDGSVAKLTSFVFIFLEDGNITVDGDNVTVKGGDMKFNAEIVDWPFCAPCNKQNKEINGAFLDFYVEIKGKKQANATGTNKFDVGGASVITPREVTFDNTTTEDMPDGYPKLETQGVKQTFIFRFRKFSKSALYDPLVSLTQDGGSDNGGGGSGDTNTTAEKVVASSGVTIKIKGASGKVDMSSGSKVMTMEFDNLSEKKEDGNKVKESSHVTNTFASQQFTFSPVTDGTYLDTNIAVQLLTFQSDLKNGANLKIYTYIFQQDGNITQENETTLVKKGNVKFNIEIKGWTFCDGSCTGGEVGKYLDIDIVMKGKGGDAKKANTGSGNKYTLGDSGTVTLSGKIKKDNSADLVDMENGYPMLITQGSKQIFRFRFPKFNSEIVYDPTFDIFSAYTGSAVKNTVSFFMLVALSFLLYML